MLLVLPQAAHAQRRGRPLVLAGRLVRVRGADTAAVAHARIVAHRVGQARQGPIDSGLTDAKGGFRFVVVQPETGAVYVVSTLRDGIGYFSDPVAPGNTASAALTLVVFDTSSAGPPLEVGTRNVVVTRGAGGQGHRVLDIYQVENPGTATRVAPDSLGSTFSVRLPSGVTGPESGASDIPASAIRFEGNRALVSAPFPPGDKQVVISYTLPAGLNTFEVPIDQATGEVDLMLEDSTAQPSDPLHPTDPVAIEGHTFRRYAANDMAAGSSFKVRFSRGSSRRATLFAALAAGALLAAGAAFALTRRGEVKGETSERLVAQLAALDDRFSGREQATPPETWASYQARRAALKAALARRLAQG
ncbi:MAG: hypothetical protein ACHQU8_02535 [Gemmatimonadales bacterium]